MTSPLPTARVNCAECGGSGYFRGTHGDIECIDCGGEGQWDEPAKCQGCDKPVAANGWCEDCREWLVEIDRDPKSGRDRIAA